MIFKTALIRSNTKMSNNSRFTPIGVTLFATGLSFIFIVFSSQTSLIGQVSAQNTCHLRELDLCAATLLVFAQGGLATNDQDINKQCNHLRDANMCLNNYTTRCMTPVQREMVKFASNSSIQLMDEYCTRGSKLRTTYLKHSTCLNQIQKSNGQKDCLQDLQASVELFSSSSGSKSGGGGGGKEIGVIEHGKRLKLACCTYRRFESCLGSRMEKKCGKEATQFVSSVMRRATSRLPEVMCRQYKPDGQECRDILPKSGTIPRGAKSNSILSRLLSAYSGL